VSKNPFVVIAGPCVIEDEGLTLEIAQELKKQLADFPVELYFKASFDKANRSSVDSYRGPGVTQGLKTLNKVKNQQGHMILSDVHLPDQINKVVEVVDFLQIPAFLCRQTDLVVAAAEACLRSKKKLNIKKGQFLAPWDAKNIVGKVKSVEAKFNRNSNLNDWFYITERGSCFGYNQLMVDMSSFQVINQFDTPVIYDATHSVQMPGAAMGGKTTGGKREVLEVLARAAMAAGANGLFLECHPNPDKAKSDGPNAFYLEHVGEFVKQCLAIRNFVSEMPKLLPESKNLK